MTTHTYVYGYMYNTYIYIIYLLCLEDVSGKPRELWQMGQVRGILTSYSIPLNCLNFQTTNTHKYIK